MAASAAAATALSLTTVPFAIPQSTGNALLSRVSFGLNKDAVANRGKLRSVAVGTIFFSF
jgi:hypothetical protein